MPGSFITSKLTVMFEFTLKLITRVYCCSMPRGQETFVFIADIQGWGYSNCDIRAYMAALDIMQVCSPSKSYYLMSHIISCCHA